MKGIDFAKYCQSMVERVKRNYWRIKKLSKNDLNKDILFLSKKTNTSPIMVLRYKYKRMGYNKRKIMAILNLNSQKISEEMRSEIILASKNDPVYSQKGIEFSYWRGKEGEEIIKDWLEYKKIKFKQDPGNDKIGLPDFLLKESITINNKRIKWIESKCSYGNLLEQKNNIKQFTKFDNLYGNDGSIVYWFGFEKNNKLKRRFILNWEDILRIIPNHLHERVNKLVNDIPEEFEHLIYPIKE